MRYLTAEDIIKINVMAIGKYSPNEPVGIADPNSLQMIVEQPKQEIFGKVLYPDIYSKAAIIWINLIKKHPFYNANKRTAVLALHMFLAMNGYQSHLSLSDGLEKTIEIATFQGDFEDLKKIIIHFLKQDGNITKL
ncbi:MULTISPECIES: type II toxin-antitoxin system death-on-curing family toxin [Streptococcus]|uniref:Type II toxin-antitoxin system death-on-curing family toxin n=1 Tax=Streptococcus ruminantium TaxID=1917441 RepID=A0A2Z5U5D2_9STRE|nr:MULTISPECIES: type II toxin-antitoxin system death-on-curing family toxin [Streptococcus]MDQ8758639.1 type II toxin-antitoxin system death-on-curing family toxin [Streptococcus ruminantium]MDQ8764535.1 type II toxin-antitoxin system death-on-curing family toxin [Streptococcus ruminantium]MDQ8769401.1 type II toxin-antitoxin system death-on-curing family toxin [Streptococcus ruminantium]MDQ8774084.1 type II toxin-antitoxin system death-on-curing family toxin [Streptococcus ruminantium]MDQ879